MAPTLDGWQARYGVALPRAKPTRWAYGACRHAFRVRPVGEERTPLLDPNESRAGGLWRICAITN